VKRARWIWLIFSLSAALAETGAVMEYKPGVRPARPDNLTITDVRSNRVRYDENAIANTRAIVINTTATERRGTLIALMHVDLDTVREVARTAWVVAPQSSSTWEFTYNVGPETYGRGLEVRFVDAAGTVVDQWQEFYAVAAEWFRVQQHSYEGQNKKYEINPWVTYYNQRHYFASEPTDLGVQSTVVDDYLSGQVLWNINRVGRRQEIDHFSKYYGAPCTFYQTFAFCGPMGYEAMREHPEYVLFDANGQFSVDPIYGGYPNPMELASPLEMGAKRQLPKPYLNRKVTSWQHSVANLAREDVITFEANCVKEYAKQNGFDGIYTDGTWGIFKGYGYDGKPNVPAGRAEDYARLNARNHRVFSQIVKQDNPNFGTWFNWAKHSGEFYTGQGYTHYLGSGTGKDDPSDEAIRAAADWKNVMFLNEQAPMTASQPDWLVKPGEYLESLTENRDYIVQKYGGNVVIGYNWFNAVPIEEPGPSKWGWPTVNYFGAQLIATQTHHAGGWRPSFRPSVQFMTRYSSLLWARDLKVVPVAEAEKLLRVTGGDDVWWQRLVYRRQTDQGFDLLVHLVRKPPYQKWDLLWLDEPVPLTGLKLSVDCGQAEVTKVFAFRPYYFEEDQQPVETVVAATVTGQAATITVPPFRYHTLVIFRLRVAERK
jgi:hypothetical protein